MFSLEDAVAYLANSDPCGILFEKEDGEKQVFT